MPFDFLKRKKDDGAAPTPDAVAGPEPRPVAFDGLTEEWRLVGEMHIVGRLSDALNRREPIAIGGVSWAPLDGSAPLTPVPGLRSVDPYDLLAVLTGDGSLPTLDDAERAAHRVHKIPYDVALELPPLRVIGTVYLHPGSDPDRLLDRATEMFVPVVDAAVSVGGTVVADGVGTILVNRSYLRAVGQVDRRTGEAPARLPGQPMGGISWQDRSR